MVDDLAASGRARPRPLWLIYDNPEHGDPVERSGLFGEPAEVVRRRMKLAPPRLSRSGGRSSLGA